MADRLLILERIRCPDFNDHRLTVYVDGYDRAIVEFCEELAPAVGKYRLDDGVLLT